MRKLPRKARWPAVLAISVSLGISAGAQAPAPPRTFAPAAERPEDLPDAPGREETFYACTACHNFKLVAAQGMTRAQWDDSLTWMTTRHNMAELRGAERDLILDYLEKHYPPKTPARAGGWRNPFAPP